MTDPARCDASKFDARCQLVSGHSSDHIAMIGGRGRRDGFAIWRTGGQSSWQAEIDTQEWAATFPRIESPADRN